MSITNNKENGRFMGIVGPVVAVGVGLFADRIRHLEAEERAAVMKGDWLAARSAAVEKAKFKEAQHRAAAESRRGRA
jgi:ABC-type Co2+ transport system permease subunit